MKHHLPSAVRRLLLLAAASFALLLTARAQAPFEVRFENDAQGKWLVYPTVPGWHYRIESGYGTAEADFTFVTGSFRYDNGSERR